MAETSEPAAAEQPNYAEIAKEQGDVAAVAQLLQTAEASQIETDQPAQGGEQPAPAADRKEEQDELPGLSEEGLGMEQEVSVDAGITSSLQTLAEKSGLTLDEVYAVAVPLGDGRDPTTLGALKDQFQDYSRLVEKTETFEVSRLEFENNMIRSRAELQEIVKLLPQGAVTDELIAEASRTYAETRQKEQTALLAIKPDWKDPAAYSLAQDQILETASEYGFNRADLNAVMDHRLIKLLHDFHVMRKRFADANASVKRVVNVNRQKRANRSQGAPARELNAQIADATKGKSTQDKALAIAALLNKRT